MIKNINESQMKMVKLLDKLSLREQRILRMRFIQNMTQHQVGKLYKITNERVRQLEDRSLKIVNEVIISLISSLKD